MLLTLLQPLFMGLGTPELLLILLIVAIIAAVIIMTSKKKESEHSDKLALSIICTIFLGTVFGIIAIIFSAKSNKLYYKSIEQQDVTVKDNLFKESQQSNNTARTWIAVSIIVGIIRWIGVIILFTF